MWRHTRRGDKYVTVIIDLTGIRDDTGPARLLDMVEGSSEQAFKQWLADRPQSWRDGVEVVAMDGFTGFKTATTEELPDAVAVMDPLPRRAPGRGRPGPVPAPNPADHPRAPLPDSRKGQVRACMITRLFEAHRTGEIRAVSGRASDFFGPGVRQSQLGEQVWPRLLRGKPVWWLGDPDATHTFTYAPDFARALVRLGSEPDAWGRAWHVPSPPDLTLRKTLARAATIAGVNPPTVHRIPRFVLRAAGLVVPIAGELPEVAYQFDNRFVMDWDDYRTKFDAEATDWDVALHTTLDWWQNET